MDKLLKTFDLIRRNVDDWGVSLLTPLSNAAASATRAAFERSFGVPFPTDYDRLLTFSDGLHTQRGSLFNSTDILQWNEEHLRRTPSVSETPDGVVIESVAKSNPPPFEYLWIGCYGNMDMYAFHVSTKTYRVASLGFDDVYGQFDEFAEFLLYLADPAIELVEPD